MGMRVAASRWQAVVVVMGLLAVASVAIAREPWGPFRGQVVDLETGRPIAGAVMLVVWREIVGVPFGREAFYDAREAVTDAEGRWETPRLSVPLLKLGVQPPTFHLFAPGYEVRGDVVTPTTGEVFVDPTVSQMRPVKTREDRIRNQRNYPPNIPAGKMPQMLDAVNRDRAALGLERIEHGGSQ